MKKIIALFIFITAVILAPLIAPISFKLYLFSLITKNHPGTFRVSDITLSYFNDQEIEEFSWIHNNSKLYIPSLKIKGSIISILLHGNIPIEFESASLLYKEKKLFTNIKASLPLSLKGNSLFSFAPCYLKGSIELEGTKAYTNHILIPPFSASDVFLTIDRLSFDTEKFKSLKLSGSLDLQRVKCSKNHLLCVILSLLRQPLDRDIVVDCGKTSFITDDGILLYKKTPFILDETFEIVSKGTVNMVTDQLNLAIGLTTDSLIHAFNFTSLPKGVMVPFKISGSTHKPKIDTKSAIANIAALLLLKKMEPNQRVYPKIDVF